MGVGAYAYAWCTCHRFEPPTRMDIHSMVPHVMHMRHVCVHVSRVGLKDGVWDLGKARAWEAVSRNRPGVMQPTK
jgi:hypothetical protein